MIDKNMRFIGPVGHRSDLDVPADEPSHIHIARPSRLLRRDQADSSLGPIDQVHDLAATEVTVQAA